MVGAGLVHMMLLRGLLMESRCIPSASLEPRLRPEDRILVYKIGGASSQQRGDLVVFDCTHTSADPVMPPGPGQSSAVGRTMVWLALRWPLPLNESGYVKRVVGLRGDHVVCCDVRGLLTVNDMVVKEPSFYPGDKPSDLTFDVLAAAERILAMGDHCGDSADSRARLGNPGGRTVRIEDVIGRAGMNYWPGAPQWLRGLSVSTVRERRA